MRKLKGFFVAAVLAAMLLPATDADAATARNQNRNRLRLASAVVNAIDGTTITATRNSVVYTIDASNATIRRRYSARAAFSEIMVGDTIRVWGTIDGTNIVANKIQDMSIQKWKATFNGTITAIDNVGTPNNFTLQSTGRGTLTVNVYDTTVFKYKKKTARTFADLVVGDRVVAKGIWNRANNLVYNTTWVNIKATTAAN